MNRRHVLSLVGSTLLLGGCITHGTATSTDEPKPEAAEPATPTPTATPELTPEELRPAAKNGWELERTTEEDWRYMTGVDGDHAFYTSPDGIPFEVIVVEVKDGFEPARIARSWKCYPAWQVTLGYQGFAIAAGSGTSQETGTPDVPKMTRTPSPNTTDDARKLLSYSPRLGSDEIASHEIESC